MQQYENCLSVLSNRLWRQPFSDLIRHNTGTSVIICGLACLLTLVAGCSPTVRVEAPREPITINMNIKIEHQIRVKIDREIDEVLSEDSGLF